MCCSTSRCTLSPLRPSISRMCCLSDRPWLELPVSRWITSSANTPKQPKPRAQLKGKIVRVQPPSRTVNMKLWYVESATPAMFVQNPSG